MCYQSSHPVLPDVEALVSKAIKINMHLFKMITRKKGASLNLNLLDSDTTSTETRSMSGVLVQLLWRWMP